MSRTDYRPKVGETVFVSLSGNLPLLVTITGFHYHTYLKEEVMDFDRLDGTSSWSGYKKQVFYTEIPVDTPYLYVLVLNYSDGYDSTHQHEEAFFFTPEAAFAHCSAIQAGEIQARFTSPYDHPDYTVEVRKVT